MMRAMVFGLCLAAGLCAAPLSRSGAFTGRIVALQGMEESGIQMEDPVLLIVGYDPERIYRGTIEEGENAIYETEGLLQVVVREMTFVTSSPLIFSLNIGNSCLPVPKFCIPFPDRFAAIGTAASGQWPMPGGSPEWTYGLGILASGRRGLLPSLEPLIDFQDIFLDERHDRGGFLTVTESDGALRSGALFVIDGEFEPGDATSAAIHNPEPSSVGLCALGVGTIWLMRRRLRGTHQFASPPNRR